MSLGSLVLQRLKFSRSLAPAAILNNGSATFQITDTVGAKGVLFLFHFGTTDVAATTLKITESDDSAMSGATDITGTVFGTASGTALPTTTSDNGFFGVYLNIEGQRKRYLQPALTVGNSTGAYVTCIAILDPLDEAPATATARGLILSTAQAIV